MSKTLIKLVDFSLLPAALLIVGKVLGLWIAVNFFELEWGLETIPNNFFSVRPIFFSKDIILASTYSDIVMFIVIVIGYSAVLIQALIFHNSHISPVVVAKLANYNLLGLVKSTFEIYHKAAIWSIFLWLSNILILINVLTSKTEVWVLVFSISVSLILSIFLLKDVANEIELSKKSISEKFKPISK